MKKVNSQIHVRIDEPIKLRRILLESAIEAAESLKIYERFKAIRREKKRQEKELKAIIKELKIANEVLIKNLPLTDYGSKPKRIVTPKEIKEIKEPIKPRVVKHKSKLEMDLDSIREKLSKL